MLNLSRRQALAGSLLLAPAVTATLNSSPAFAGPAGKADIEGRLAALERKTGGRLGIAIHDVASGTTYGNRADERFLMASTFKLMVAAFILARVDRKQEQLERRIPFTKRDLVSWSPGTEKHAGGPGLTVAELCEATMTMSDNTAANLLLKSFGGPAALTGFARSLGDDITRHDRTEPALNALDGPDDQHDTTTPAAMVGTLRKLLFGDALSRRSRDRLTAWMITNETGDERLRAGFPSDWLVGDKTGTSRSGAANDIGVAWPNGRAPLLVTAYCEMPAAKPEARNAAIAEIARIAATV
jgi:beta-lactamase class A